MAYIENKEKKIIDSDEQIGAFSGYIRRPHPTVAGMIAQFFGENGEDADTITVLSLSKFQDAQVYINVFLIKDSLGRVMKENGSYPNIANFLGVIRRPSPTRGGMIAQFFSPNGTDSDSVNDLGKSIYQDCLVYVDIKGKLAKNLKETTPEITDKVIDDNYMNKVTELQKKEYFKKVKTYEKINNELKLSGFLRNSEVLYALGSEVEYKHWLTNDKTCSFVDNSKCLITPIEILEIKGVNNYFNFLPFCSKHKALMEQSYENQSGGLNYLEMRCHLHMQEWAWKKLKDNFSLTGVEEPDPNKILEFSIKNKLDILLPQKYKNAKFN